MAEEIFHAGRIVEITPDFTTVEIVSESACSSCHAKGLCSLGESKTKAIQVPTRGWDNYQVGDEVTVTLKASMGHKAVWIAYMIPLALLIAVLLILSGCGVGELASGLWALGAVAVYYLFIRLFGKRLKNEYIFNIKQ
ncbi:MAG: SoxR reducing system RseC family protein [Bacteroidales bacterium]|nr:SoxR reducing system RseC family protein [Candidatus Cryptobacteroides choladohippi]